MDCSLHDNDVNQDAHGSPLRDHTCLNPLARIQALAPLHLCLSTPCTRSCVTPVADLSKQTPPATQGGSGAQTNSTLASSTPCAYAASIPLSLRRSRAVDSLPPPPARQTSRVLAAGDDPARDRAESLVESMEASADENKGEGSSDERILSQSAIAYSRVYAALAVPSSKPQAMGASCTHISAQTPSQGSQNGKDGPA